MRPHTLTKMMFDCRCGKSHPQVTRLAGVPVLLCPECPNEALRLHIGPTGNVVIVMGERRVTDVDSVHEWAHREFVALGARLDALEAKGKGRGKE